MSDEVNPQPDPSPICPTCGGPRGDITVGNNSFSNGHGSPIKINDIDGMKKEIRDPMRDSINYQAKQARARHEDDKAHTTEEAKTTRDMIAALFALLLKMSRNPESPTGVANITGDNQQPIVSKYNSPENRGVRILAYCGLLIACTTIMCIGVGGVVKFWGSVEDHRVTQTDTHAEYRDWYQKNAIILRQEDETDAQYEARKKKWDGKAKSRLETMKSFELRKKLDKDIITLSYDLISGAVLSVILGYMGAGFAKDQLQLLQKAEIEYGPANADGIRRLIRKLWPFS